MITSINSQEFRLLTGELTSLHHEIQSGIYDGRKYEVITEKLTEHKKKIVGICQRCLLHPDFLEEFNAYFQEMKAIQALIPPLEAPNEKILNIAHMKIFGMKKDINEARVIRNISLAFHLSPDQIQEQIRERVSRSSEGFFVESANLCIDLANIRLYQTQPLNFEEVRTIHQALFDPSFLTFTQDKANSSDCIHPHPAYVFDNLYKFLTSVETNDSCEEIQDALREYLETQPDKGTLIAFLELSKIQQQTTLKIIQKDAAKGDEPSQNFLQDLNLYQIKLKEFEEGIKDFPIVNTRVALEKSININETFFLNVNGKACWVFKPISENGDKGPKIFQAECTASRLNYHHQFPVPLTIPLLIKNWEGSAQMYVENGLTVDQIKEKRMPIDRDPLQKLAIFDLLFANSDRNDANFLFLNLEGSAKILGIDHDSCLMFQWIMNLKMDYLQFPALSEPLQESMLDLFSPEAISNYKRIMTENAVSESQFNWLDIVVEELNKAYTKQTPLREVIIKLKINFDEMFLNY